MAHPGISRSATPSDLNDGEPRVCRSHSQFWGLFMALGISLSVCIDILQYAMPLAFLPSVLEDSGSSSFQIATAIGVYYWTGFLVTCSIAAYQVVVLIVVKPKKSSVVTMAATKRQMYYILAALTAGTITLIVQGAYASFRVHLICRTIQGGCGGIIFVYCFLLACKLFEGKQQVLALTLCSIMFNVAEVLGSYLGALIFDSWGERFVFYSLAVMSFLCQVWQVVIMLFLKEELPPPTGYVTPPVMSTNMPVRRDRAGQGRGWDRLVALIMSRRLIVSVLLISTAAAVKGAVEESLPFHADHEWNAPPMKIGEYFCIIAGSYIVAALCMGKLWGYLDCGSIRIYISGAFLIALGLAAWFLFTIYFYRLGTGWLLFALGLYGVCLGLVFTPATLILGDAVENEESGQAKDAVNSLWNAAWEAGGSFGFLLGAFLAESYAKQMQLMCGLAIISAVVALVVIVIPLLPTFSMEVCCSTRPEEDRLRSGMATPGMATPPLIRSRPPELQEAKVLSSADEYARGGGSGYHTFRPSDQH